MKLELPYQNHLAFVHENPFKIESIHNFEQLYEHLKGNGPSINRSQLTQLSNNCIASLTNIFIDLLKQAKDERETLFLEDLQKHSLRLLKEDIDVFLKRRSSDATTIKTDLQKDKSKFDEQKFVQGRLSDESISNISNSISDLIVKFRENAKEGKTKREELSQNTGSIVRKVVGVLNIEFRRNGVLSIISSYMGIDMCVTGLSIELSVPGANWWKVNYSIYDRPPKTLYYHFDESLAYPKAIVYVSDVTEKNGATSCAPTFVRNSTMTNLQFLIGRAITCVGKEKGARLTSFYDHKYHQTFGCPVFRNDFSRLPLELKFSSHFGWDVIPGSELEDFLLKDEQKIIGKAGTYIAFDGGLLPHRGGMILEGDRIALQVVFGEKLPLFKKVIKKVKQLIK